VTCSLIDLVWLTSFHFAVVYSIPNPCECHIYAIRSLKSNGIELIRTLSVGLNPKSKLGTPNKKISLHQPSEIIKLDRIKRKDQHIELILLFAMKTDGDLFVLEIDSNDLSNKNEINKDFQGPICILPSTFDNYGSDHGQSTFICLSESKSPLIIFTRDQIQLHQSLILNPSSSQYNLYTIENISLPTSQTGQILTTFIKDRFHSNRYFVLDSLGNIYSIEINWIKQIQQGSQQFQSTNIQHLLQSNNSNQKLTNHIQQIAVLQSHLAVIHKSLIDQQRDLILIRLPTINSIESNEFQFIDHLRSLLIRQQSIPYLTLSSSSTNISNVDFEKNLLLMIQILIREYIQKQENLRKEIENKQKYLVDFQQTQANQTKSFTQRFQQIQQTFQNLSTKYEKECSRRKRLSTQVDDLLSVIEQNTPVLSDAEIRMQQQLQTYAIQIDCLKEKIQLLRQFMSNNQDQQQDFESVHHYLHDQINQIQLIKQRLDIIQQNQ